MRKIIFWLSHLSLGSCFLKYQMCLYQPKTDEKPSLAHGFQKQFTHSKHLQSCRIYWRFGVREKKCLYYKNVDNSSKNTKASNWTLASVILYSDILWPSTPGELPLTFPLRAPPLILTLLFLCLSLFLSALVFLLSPSFTEIIYPFVSYWTVHLGSFKRASFLGPTLYSKGLNQGIAPRKDSSLPTKFLPVLMITFQSHYQRLEAD